MGDLLMLNQSGELACSFLIENVFHESIFASGVDLLRGAPIFLSVADALLNALLNLFTFPLSVRLSNTNPRKPSEKKAYLE